MIISHSRHFIFAHLYKTGGTSISNALSSYGHSRVSRKSRLMSMLRLYPPIYSEDYPKHSHMAHLKKNLPLKIFDWYFKFAFVRNSWDWQVSLYHYILKDQSNQHHAIVKGLGNFESYLVWRTQPENVSLQHDFVCDNGGNLLVDYLGTYSSLTGDLEKISQHLGLRNLELPHLNRGNRSAYQDYYSPEGKDLIFKAYKSDVKRFGFEF